MSNWNIIVLDSYTRRRKRFEKKRPNELMACENNLDTYINALNGVKSHLQVKAGFIHDEPNGLKALDQSGGRQKVKLTQTRLYVFPVAETYELYILTIGTKSEQKEDIKLCQQAVEEIRKDISKEFE